MALARQGTGQPVGGDRGNCVDGEPVQLHGRERRVGAGDGFNRVWRLCNGGIDGRWRGRNFPLGAGGRNRAVPGGEFSAGQALHRRRRSRFPGISRGDLRDQRMVRRYVAGIVSAARFSAVYRGRHRDLGVTRVPRCDNLGSASGTFLPEACSAWMGSSRNACPLWGSDDRQCRIGALGSAPRSCLGAIAACVVERGHGALVWNDRVLLARKGTWGFMKVSTNGRAGLAFGHDVMAAALAWIGLFWLRFNLELHEPQLSDMLQTLAWVLPLQAGIFLAFGLYRGLWRFAR